MRPAAASAWGPPPQNRSAPGAHDGASRVLVENETRKRCPARDLPLGVQDRLPRPNECRCALGKTLASVAMERPGVRATPILPKGAVILQPEKRV